ncbi:unnamed protein product [Paramecium sonneborni]|uniref:Transmembrane protein n=1 Tax=Paramecium sonneborni TaxID=65129 RepID=A0A8S1QW31_9CILI|nr:unnamed protein product [Paramecium sonneborni]
MKMLINLIFLIVSQSFEIQPLDSEYQSAYQQVKIDDDNFLSNKLFTFGLWQRYNPLSTISQVGQIGLFDSNCYHLLNIIDTISDEINLIYYDCLDYEAKTITKYVKFVNNDDEQKIFKIDIEAFNYENFWYFLEIIQNPFQQQFEILIISQETIRIHEIHQMKYPFKGRNLKFTYGNSLIVSNSGIESLLKEQKFSYFPGKIIIQQFSLYDQLDDLDWYQYVKGIFMFYEYCFCMPNFNYIIPDQNINQQLKGEYVSDNLNCDSFILEGWFKIQEIISEQKEFVFPFLKLGTNFQNPNLSNDNLSPVQVFYKLSDIQNQIIVTTYSFTFPQVTIDFTNNPFLIEKTFDIINNITLWQKISVKLIYGIILDIQIKFYENFMIYEYSHQIEVRQFQQIQFLLQYGNFQKLETNYLNMYIRNLLFLNCDVPFEEKHCHYTCLECDGPTSNDCLSCSEESKRIYLPEYKICNCPYNTIEDQICIGYIESNLLFIDEPFLNDECKYGYFELNNECIQCPSIIRQDLITCLECIQNPKSFYEQTLCQYDLYLSKSSQTGKLFLSEFDYLLFDGTDYSFYLCFQCPLQMMQDLNLLYIDYNLRESSFRRFCKYDYTQCYQHISFECIGSHLHITGQRCMQCKKGFKLINGLCIKIYEEEKQVCHSPHYFTYKNQCNLCPIKNCIYCFEYQNEDSTFQSTLFKDFKEFDINQEVKIGCSMCEQNFVFDFTIGQCLKQKPKILNCLRSFINLDGTELCTLSSLQDFSVAREIINCQNYYSNCLQCVLTPQSKIQCVLCSEGYAISLISGNCYKSYMDIYFQNATLVVQAEFDRLNGEIIFIQSFMMQFLPDQYYYPYSQNLMEFQIKCKDGHGLTLYYFCQQYCSQDCLKCQVDYDHFNCVQCSSNYYKIPLKSEAWGQCISCSDLCQYCERRDSNEIKSLQQYFNLEQSNIRFTRKCILPVNSPNVAINPFLFNAKYCFNKSCYNKFSYYYYFTYCIINYYFPEFYEEDINIQYCNHVGVDDMTINYSFKLPTDSDCSLYKSLQFQTTFKNKIFSLKKIGMTLSSIYDTQIVPESFTITTNFDKVEISNINLRLQNGFIIQNNNQKVDITLRNLILNANNISDELIFQTYQYGQIEIENVQISDSIFTNSSLFDFSLSSIPTSITINKLQFINSVFNNSILFNFNNSNSMINIQEIIIKNCLIQNSSFFSFNTELKQANFIYLFGVEIFGSNFQYSQFLKCNNKFDLQASNLYFHDNTLFQSIIMAFNDNTQLKNVKTSQNILIGSAILSTIFKVNNERVLFMIDDFEDSQTTFQESNLIIIYSILQVNDFFVHIKNIKVQENILIDTSYQRNQLFKFRSRYLQIENSQFLNLKNAIFFYLFETYEIVFDFLRFENSQQQHKVPLSQLCSDSVQWENQIIQLAGFQQLSLSNIQIINQFIINYSLMDIAFSKYFVFEIIGQVKLINIYFNGNILLKNKQATSFSLFSLNSQYNLNIDLVNFQFIQNIINQQIDEPLETQTSLLQVNSLDSIIKINQIFCQNNAITNSSTQFITLSAKLIEISNLNIFNQNILTQSLWQQFYDFELDDSFNQEQINSIIQSTFGLLNQGILITASTFSCTDSYFQDIFGLKSAIFEIKTQGQGIVKISNLKINSIQTNLKEQRNQGCISIVSTNGFLNIQLNHILFTNIFNKMGSSLFTITPSVKSNFIYLNNVIIDDCISLINTIMLTQFQPEVMQQSLVKINNITIYQSEQSWIDLFSKIGTISQSEINNIRSENNAMIYLENCKVEIKNLKMYGIAFSPIIKILNAPQVKLLDCNLISIQKFYSFNLIHISQTLITESIISVQGLKIIESFTYQKKSDEITIFQDLNYIILGCNIQKSYLVLQKVLFSDILQKIQDFPYVSNQIIYTKSISDKNSLIFHNILILKNNGSDFSNGIISFEIEKFKLFKLENIQCYQNSINENGCIHFLIPNFINQTIRIKDSYFIQNKGSFGGAIVISNVKLIVINSKIISNQVSKFGGGMFLQLKEDDFQIISTIITNNIALDGGGIYFNKDANLKLNNFIQSFLLFNKATQFGDNLVETPYRLVLSINDKEMQSKQLIIDQLKNEILVLQPYTIIEQGTTFIQNYLMLPSNQVIFKYQIYSPQSLQYFSFITSFGLLLKNSFNEKLQNNLNSTCILSNQVLNLENKSMVGEQSEKITMQYDLQKDYFDLGELSLTFDPYTKENKILQMQISCYSGDKQKRLNYLIETKSFKCQLGEFYVNSGCQICQSSQGFYSVVYDATKCSIFDKTRFKNITENNIELLQGFWRPYYLSDYIEQCFKNLQFCKGGWEYGNQLCSEGHVGALCEECDIYNVRGDGKYFKNQQDSVCISCFGVQDSIIPFVAASIWSLLSIIITLRSIEQSNQLFKNLKLNQKFSKILFKLEQGHESFIIKMLLNYMWIFSVIFTFNIQFSFTFTFVDSASNTSYSMANNLDCYLSENQSIQLIYSKIITMLVLMLIQFTLIIIGFLMYYMFKKMQLKYYIYDTISNTILYLYVSNYGGLIKMYFSILSKRDVSNQSYIQGDVSLLFGSKEHIIWIFSFVIPGIGIFCLIIPLFLYLLMFFKKNQLDDIKIRKYFCYLFNEYENDCYFWEQIKIIKKTIMILILTYFETYILLKASLLGLCLLFYQLLAVKNKPFILQNLNHLDLFSGQICSITIFLAAAKFVAEQENNQFSSVVLQTFIVILCLRLTYPFILSILRVYYKKYYFLIINYLHLITNKISQDSKLTFKLQMIKQSQIEREKKQKHFVSKLRQHLLKVSQAQISNKKKILNGSKNSQNSGNEFKYFVKLDTE